jgi:hypothetical protein
MTRKGKKEKEKEKEREKKEKERYDKVHRPVAIER